MNKEKIHKIEFPMYEYKVHIVYTSNIQHSRDLRNDVLDGAVELSHYVDGLHSTSDRDLFTSYIFFTPKSSYGVITHEAYHVVCRMFKTIEAEHEEELFAYHLGYITDECVKLKLNTAWRNAK